MTTKYFTCPACDEHTTFRTHATDRAGLERDIGETFMATCRHCLCPRSLHVNEIHAQPNRAITAAGGLAGIVAIAVLWQIGFLAYLACALPVVVYQAQRTAAANFNGYNLPVTRPQR